MDEGRKHLLLIAASIPSGPEASAVRWREARSGNRSCDFRRRAMGGRDHAGNRPALARQKLRAAFSASSAVLLGKTGVFGSCASDVLSDQLSQSRDVFLEGGPEF